MFMTVTESDFIREFKLSQWRNNFSHEELRCIFEYLREYDVELDVCAIACEFTSADVRDVLSMYDAGIAVTRPLEATNELLDAVTEWLSERTTVLGCVPPDRVIFASF